MTIRRVVADELDLAAIKTYLRGFAADRDWEQFHTPKNLAMALASEAGELLEVFRWLTPEESAAVGGDPERIAQVGEELADILQYLIRIADVLDIDLASALWDKLERNVARYPAEPLRKAADLLEKVKRLLDLASDGDLESRRAARRLLWDEADEGLLLELSRRGDNTQLRRMAASVLLGKAGDDELLELASNPALGRRAAEDLTKRADGEERLLELIHIGNSLVQTAAVHDLVLRVNAERLRELALDDNPIIRTAASRRLGLLSSPGLTHGDEPGHQPTAPGSQLPDD
jgi:dCTP diphosphatase